MIHRVLTLVFVAVLLLGSGVGVAAQEATPPAVSVSPDIYTVDGALLGTIQITAVEDGYLLYDPTTPPQYGTRYVAVTMDIQNRGERPWTINPAHFVLVDEDGFAMAASNLRFTEEARMALLTSQDIAPGATLTASLVYQIALGSDVSRLVYSPANDRLLTVARFGDSAPEPGADVAIESSDGSVIARVTIESVQSPFTDYDLASPPERGSLFVLITIMIVNDGPRPMRLDPQAFALIDGEGFVEGPITIRRGDAPPADLERIDPFVSGSTEAGAIGYMVFSGVPLDTLVYSPSRDRIVELADLSAFGG
jgi:hypothetical protein